MISKPRPTLDQQRAAYAWQCVTRVDRQHHSDYTNLAKSAPALIMNNGLMQTLAFLQDKASWDAKKKIFKKPHCALLSDHIRIWLGERLRGERLSDGKEFPSKDETEGLEGYGRSMGALFAAPSDLYRRATDESLALLRWIRQLAAAHKG